MYVKSSVIRNINPEKLQIPHPNDDANPPTQILVLNFKRVRHNSTVSDKNLYLEVRADIFEGKILRQMLSIFSDSFAEYKEHLQKKYLYKDYTLIVVVSRS